MRDRVAFAAAALALAFAAGLHVGRVEADEQRAMRERLVTLQAERSTRVWGVSCPSEDSCRPDYRNGAWHIIPLDPEDI